MNIIRQDASGMRIYRSEKDYPKMPVLTDMSIINGFGRRGQYIHAVADWFTSAETIPVHPNEEYKFFLFIIDIGVAANVGKAFAEKTEEGIPIPDDCFYKGQDGYAYFKEPAKKNACYGCGRKVKIASSDEGTNYYVPDENQDDLWDELLTEYNGLSAEEYGPWLEGVKRKFKIERL